MANTLSTESKNIIKRVLIGVVTGLATTSAIYFIGFNKSPAKLSQIEIKKNTVKAWRVFVELENKMQPKYDSNLAKVRRSAITMREGKSLDSIVSVDFLKQLTAIRETKDIDQDFSLLLATCLNYKHQEIAHSVSYITRFISILDSPIAHEAKVEMVQELNEENENKRNNFIERVGRSIEDVATVLARKYKYPFSIADFDFNLFYQTLKKSKRRQNTLPEQPAPSDPNGSNP